MDVDEAGAVSPVWLEAIVVAEKEVAGDVVEEDRRNEESTADLDGRGFAVLRSAMSYAAMENGDKGDDVGEVSVGKKDR